MTKFKYTLTRRRLEEIAERYTHTMKMGLALDFPSRQYETHFEKSGRNLSHYLSGRVTQHQESQYKLKRMFGFADSKDIATIDFNVTMKPNLLHPRITVHHNDFLNSKTLEHIELFHATFPYAMAPEPEWVYDMPVTHMTEARLRTE